MYELHDDIDGIQAKFPEFMGCHQAQRWLSAFVKPEEKVLTEMLIDFYHSLDWVNIRMIKGKLDGNALTLSTKNITVHLENVSNKCY